MPMTNLARVADLLPARPHPFAQGAPQIAPGGVFSATLAAGDRWLAEAVLTLREPIKDTGFVTQSED